MRYAGRVTGKKAPSCPGYRRQGWLLGQITWRIIDDSLGQQSRRGHTCLIRVAAPFA